MLILLFSLVNFLLIFLVSLIIILSLVCKLMMLMMIILMKMIIMLVFSARMMMGEAVKCLKVAVGRLNLGLNLRIYFLSVLCLMMMEAAVFILIADFSGLLLDLEFLFEKSHYIVLGSFRFILEFL